MQERHAGELGDYFDTFRKALEAKINAAAQADGVTPREWVDDAIRRRSLQEDITEAGDIERLAKQVTRDLKGDDDGSARLDSMIALFGKRAGPDGPPQSD